MTRTLRPALQVVPDQSDQVPRLRRFCAAHPGVAITAGHGCWQARVQAAGKDTVISRYTLRELLDKLDELTGPQPDQSTG